MYSPKAEKKVILAFDISTSIIGYAVLLEESVVETGHIDLKRFGKDAFMKLDFVREKIKELLDTHQISHIFVEERLLGFASNRSSIQTLMLLAQFNFGVQCICHDMGLDPVAINASHARKVALGRATAPKGDDTKRFFLSVIQDKYPSIEFPLTRNQTPKPYCYDIVDAIITGLAGHKEHINA